MISERDASHAVMDGEFFFAIKAGLAMGSVESKSAQPKVSWTQLVPKNTTPSRSHQRQYFFIIPTEQTSLL